MHTAISTGAFRTALAPGFPSIAPETLARVSAFFTTRICHPCLLAHEGAYLAVSTTCLTSASLIPVSSYFRTLRLLRIASIATKITSH